MQIKRVEALAETKMRRVQVPKEIRIWAKQKIENDERSFAQKARITDVFIHLIRLGIKRKRFIVFKNKYVQTRITWPTNRVKIPMDVYRQLELIRTDLAIGKLKKEGEATVDAWNVLMCVLEEGYKESTRINPGE